MAARRPPAGLDPVEPGRFDGVSVQRGRRCAVLTRPSARHAPSADRAHLHVNRDGVTDLQLQYATPRIRTRPLEVRTSDRGSHRSRRRQGLPLPPSGRRCRRQTQSGCRCGRTKGPLTPLHHNLVRYHEVSTKSSYNASAVAAHSPDVTFRRPRASGRTKRSSSSSPSRSSRSARRGNWPRLQLRPTSWT